MPRGSVHHDRRAGLGVREGVVVLEILEALLTSGRIDAPVDISTPFRQAPPLESDAVRALLR